jgi:hypothetical protein
MFFALANILRRVIRGVRRPDFRCTPPPSINTTEQFQRLAVEVLHQDRMVRMLALLVSRLIEENANRTSGGQSYLLSSEIEQLEASCAEEAGKMENLRDYFGIKKDESCRH